MAHEVLKWMAGIIASILVGVTVFWLTHGVLMDDRADRDSTSTGVPTTVATPTIVIPTTTASTTSIPTPEPTPPPTPPPTATTLPNPEPLVLRTAATPDRVGPNTTAEIRVTALNGQYAPVENASVRIECASGSFVSTNSTAIEGITDDKGVFRANWKAPEATDIAVTMRVYAAKRGYVYGEDSVAVVVTG